MVWGEKAKTTRRCPPLLPGLRGVVDFGRDCLWAPPRAQCPSRGRRATGVARLPARRLRHAIAPRHPHRVVELAQCMRLPPRVVPLRRFTPARGEGEGGGVGVEGWRGRGQGHHSEGSNTRNSGRHLLYRCTRWLERKRPAHSSSPRRGHRSENIDLVFRLIFISKVPTP